MVRSKMLGGVGLVSAVVIACGLTLLVYEKVGRPAILLKIPSVDGIASNLQGRAASLRQSARSMEAAALRRETEAAEDVAAFKYLRQAQNELNAYAANLEGLVTVTDDGQFSALAPQFPKEAAELHALVDHSLSRMDAISVKLAQNALPVQPQMPSRFIQPRLMAKMQVHRDVQRHNTVGVKHSKIPAVHTKHATHRIVSSVQPVSKKVTAHTAALHAQPPLPHEQAVLAKLQRVKAFERKAAHMQPALIAAALAHRALAAGHTQMLVQPGPLHGALPVRGGALVRQGTLFDPKDLGLDEDNDSGSDESSDLPIGTPASWSDDATKYPQTTWRSMLDASKKNSSNVASAPAGGNASNATTDESNEWSPADDPRLACNKTCQDAILHSVVGISYKVVKRCVPTCATGNYVLKTYGAPLPSWTTVDELRDQDKTCTPAPEYMKCKLDLMKPVCLKFEEVMPQYCLSNPDDSVCNNCQQLERSSFIVAQNNVYAGIHFSSPQGF